VIYELSELFVERGAPDNLRSDNGSEFTADLIRGWLQRLGVKTLYIEPGSPWENGYIESFNSRFRQECSNEHWFLSLEDARQKIEAWRLEHNSRRPHSALEYQTPDEFISRIAPETTSAA